MNESKAKEAAPWRERPLSTFASPEADSFVDGPFGSDLKVSDYAESGVRILQLQNVGDLLIAKMADPLARACIVPPHVERALVVADLIKLRLDRENDFTFICSAINGNRFRREAERLATGTTRTRISLSTLKSISLQAPNAKEQFKIGELVRTVDETIEQTEALIAKYQQIKAGLLQDLFARGVVSDGRIRPARSLSPHLYKQTSLGWLPKSWEVKRASEICAAVIDCKNRTPPITDDGHPVIRTPNVRDGEFVWSDLNYTDQGSYLVWTGRGRPQTGDIVITREAPVGEVCMIPEELRDPCLGQRMMLYRPDPERVDPGFLLYALQSQRVRKHLDIISGGSTVGHVKVGDVRSLKLPCPPLAEQKMVLRPLEAVRDQLRSASQALSKLEFLKQGLMHDLLTGRVRVKVTD